VDRIKRLSYEVLDGHKSKFGEDFADNKKTLDQISIIRSKGLKNEVAGYITKFIKKEIREEKTKQARIAASKSQEQTEQEIQADTPEPTVTTVESEEIPIETVTEETIPTEETPKPVEEKTE
jgi:small subunit ribosomal protein S17e